MYDYGNSWHVEGARMTVQQFVSNSSRETVAIGEKIAQLLSSPMLLFLGGDMGTGETRW